MDPSKTVSQLASDLIRAVSRLERVDTAPASGGSRNSASSSNTSVVHDFSSRASTSAVHTPVTELSKIFNWKTSSSKRPCDVSTPRLRKKGKKRLVTWTHTFFCLANVDDW